MSDTSQPESNPPETSQHNPVEDKADAEVQQISGKPSQAEGGVGDSNAGAASSDS
ncbi:MAG: hypothetical protein JWL94_788 [Microbacteriaceae bacterium]|jgi:hypothetical protein|nr:hypothetical protein [Microbacteriaceae bacterium]